MKSVSRAGQSPVVAFRGVGKEYGDIVAVRNLDLEVRRGEFLSVLGASGCGKTTTLRLIAGFEQPTRGTVLLEGEVVNAVPAYRRPVNMVFQHYALFPHMNVAGNIAYGLRQRRPRPEDGSVRRRVDEMLEMVRLPGYGNRRIRELSGGQQQRVALARALVNEPTLLLLDEPLAALDRKLRHEMQLELQTIQRDVGITFVLVTHDQEEALSMSDRVCLMRAGSIEQIGSPRELYDRPGNRYVADFVGRSNFFAGTLESVGRGELHVRLDAGDLLVSNNPCNDTSIAAGARVVVSVRPEQFVVARRAGDPAAGEMMNLGGRVVNRIFLGEHTEYLLRVEKYGDILVMTPRQAERTEAPLDTGDMVFLHCPRASALVLRTDRDDLPS